MCTSSPEFNHKNCSKLEGRIKIFHKDTFGDQEIRLIGSHTNTDVKAILGEGVKFAFTPYNSL